MRVEHRGRRAGIAELLRESCLAPASSTARGCPSRSATTDGRPSRPRRRLRPGDRRLPLRARRSRRDRDRPDASPRRARARTPRGDGARRRDRSGRRRAAAVRRRELRPRLEQRRPPPHAGHAGGAARDPPRARARAARRAIIVYNRNSFHYWLTQVLYEGDPRGGLVKERSMAGVLSRGVEYSSIGARPLVRVYSPRQMRELMTRRGVRRRRRSTSGTSSRATRRSRTCCGAG